MESRKAPQRSDILAAYQDLKKPDVFLTIWYKRLYTECNLMPHETGVVEVAGALNGLSDFQPEVREVRSSTLIRFYRSFCYQAEKRGIPLFMAWCGIDACMILHAWYKDELTSLHWEAYEALGNDVAKSGSHMVVHSGLGIWEVRGKMRR